MIDSGDKTITATSVFLLKPCIATMYKGSKAIADDGSNKNA